MQTDPGKRPRVAVVGFRGIPATFGGIEQACEALYSRLAASGYTIKIYARSPYVSREIRFYKGMAIEVLPAFSLKGLESFGHTFWAVLRALRENPDILHFQAQGSCLFSWMPRLLRPRMRVFFTCHGLDWKRRKWSRLASLIIYLGERSSVLFPHCRIVVSRELQRYYEKRYHCPTYYIPNGVEKARQTGPEPLRSYGLGRRDYFLFVGRIVPEKRIEDIIRAFRLKQRPLKLVIVGDIAGSGSYVHKLKQMAADDAQIIFAGYQYGEMLAAFYSNARAFITASELEGMPLTLLEALSYGLMCITTDIDPHLEILKAFNTHLFAPGQVERLSEWLDAAEAMTTDQLDRLARRTIRLIEKDFGWDRQAAKLGRYYRESLSA